MSGRSWAVCVYCASGPVERRYLDLASQVGAAIGERGWTLVSGGGRVSMMGALARSARSAGGRTIGVIPRALRDREVEDTDADELLVTETMRERKDLMDAHADAFLALPGGLGTLEELTEAWTSASLGMHRKSVTLLDPDGHYAGLFDWLGQLQKHGFVAQSALDTLRLVRTVDDALHLCAPPRSEPCR